MSPGATVTNLAVGKTIATGSGAGPRTAKTNATLLGSPITVRDCRPGSGVFSHDQIRAPSGWR